MIRQRKPRRDSKPPPKADPPAVDQATRLRALAAGADEPETRTVEYSPSPEDYAVLARYAASQNLTVNEAARDLLLRELRRLALLDRYPLPAAGRGVRR